MAEHLKQKDLPVLVSKGDLPTAKESIIVYDAALEVDRQILAGQAVPPDLLDAFYEQGGSGEGGLSPEEARARTEGNPESADSETIAERKERQKAGKPEDGKAVKASDRTAGGKADPRARAAGDESRANDE